MSTTTQENCECGCHTSEHSDADMKLNGCDVCHEYYHHNQLIHEQPTQPSEIEGIVQDAGYRYEEELTRKGVPADRKGFEGYLRRALTQLQQQTEQATEQATEKRVRKEARDNLETALFYTVDDEKLKKVILAAFDALQDN